MNTFSAGSRRLRICRVLAFLTASVAACASVTIASAQTTSRADQVRALNGEVLKLQSEARRARAAEASAAVVKALEGRALALRALMASDPAAAERLAFPASVLAALEASFPNATASLEQRGHWTGELEYLIEDSVDLKSHRAVFKLHGAQEVLEVKFAGREPPGSLSGQRLSVGGVRSGRLVVASEVERLDAQQGGSATADALALACGPLGSQNVVSILVNLPSYKLPAVTTPDFVRGVLLGNAYAGSATASPDRSVDDFWRQASDGQTAVNAAAASVVGPVTLASDFNKDANGASYCDYYGMANAAMAAVDNQVDFRQYSRVQLIVPPNGACGWAGVANVGCRTQSTAGDGTFTASSAWQRADTMQSRGSAVQLSTHELGHNLGMSHASSRDFGTEPLGALGSAGTLSEYGDPHSTMGSWNFGFYAASHAANQLTWLAAGANYLTVESSGTYTIQNYEARPAGLKALKVRRGTGNDAWLWIESRQNTGLYSAALNSALFTGALIHYQDATTGGKSHLLDFSSGSGSFASAALQAGQTWTDPYSNVAVTVNAVTPGALTLTVNYGATPCTQAAPTVTAAPTAVATEYGTSTKFIVTVKNNSSSGCAAETFNLSSTAPSGWSQAYAAGALTVNPGQQAQTDLTVGVPAPHALGTYTVTGSATSAASAKAASASESVTVVEPTNRLSINLSGSGSVSVSTPVKSCTASCAVDYASGTATTVTLTATPGSRTSFAGWSGACSGTTTSCTLTVNADTTVNATFSKSGGTRRK
jgi:M6 family metalloprotease-like protein